MIEIKKKKKSGDTALTVQKIIIMIIMRDYGRYCCLQPFYLYKSQIRSDWSMAREAAGLFLEPGFVSSLVLLNHKHGITQTGKGVCVCACDEVYTNIFMCVYTQACAGISLIIIGKEQDSYWKSYFKRFIVFFSLGQFDLIKCMS